MKYKKSGLVCQGDLGHKRWGVNRVSYELKCCIKFENKNNSITGRTLYISIFKKIFFYTVYNTSIPLRIIREKN
jgi:hypothetical protein